MNPFEFSFRNMIPNFILADKNGYAMAKAIDAGVRYFLARVKEGVESVTDIAKMPEWRLDEMAWAYNVTWYDRNADVETKRRVINGMYEIFRQAGTKNAITKMIAQYFGDGKVEEWFTYDGEPYHFRSVTPNTEAGTSAYTRLERNIEDLKNVRSVYDGTDVSRDANLSILTGAYLNVIGAINLGVEEVSLGENQIQDYGMIDDAVTDLIDYGLITDDVDATEDWGTL